MEKIGICTYYNNYNYGSYLQSYALLKTIEKLGYEAYLIDFNDLSKEWNRLLHKRTIISRLKCLLINPQLLFSTFRARKIKQEQTVCSEEQSQKFDRFAKENLRFFRDDYTLAEFKAFIVGSDQVWKLSLPGLHYVFFLRFTSKSKRISYAASIGTDEIPSFNRRLLRKYLNGFNSISVREVKSVKLLTELDSNLVIQNVLDPVLLAGKEFWKNDIPKLNISGYILLYFLDSFDNNIDQVNDIISQYPNSQILLVNTGITTPYIHDCQIINPSPLEFVSLIVNSKAILTDSFHGTAFSILFSKEFYTFPRCYKIYSGQQYRLASILGMFSCSDRYMERCTVLSDIKPLDEVKIQLVLERERNQSWDYLINAIGKTNQQTPYV